MPQIEKTIVTIVDETGSGEGSLVDTLQDTRADGVSYPKMSPLNDVRFYFDVSSLTGSGGTIDMDIVTTIGGNDFVLGSFTQATAAAGASEESIIIQNCPAHVKAVWTAGGTVSDFDATIHCVRVYLR
jgi:hypothetical protein